MSPEPSPFLLQKNRVFKERQLITITVVGMALFLCSKLGDDLRNSTNCKGEPYLFINLQGNKEGDVEFMSSLQATFRRLEEKTGIYARPHMLRHYFAQSKLDAGWKLPMIANALGHKDTRATELYLRIPENERLVASKEYFEMYGSLIDEEEIP